MLLYDDGLGVFEAMRTMLFSAPSPPSIGESLTSGLWTLNPKP